MRIYELPVTTHRETIEQFGELGDRGGSADAAAEAWTKAGFGDDMSARWLKAHCFDPEAARALAELGVLPEQAATRTRDGGDGSLETIAYKVAAGDLTPRQGAVRSLSSR
ncbi:MAG: hypothetical protein QOJ25_2572, partial [Solirubrobacteraceae bacterium]|nr:hypothetical protein [Solirubrobacteraceae bacterium]